MTTPRSPRPTLAHRARRAFTLIELLATLMLAGIVLPAVVEGIHVSLTTASHARRQSEAASLAQSKLAELIATDQINDAEMTGDFGEDWPEYRWTSELYDWSEDSRLYQIDVTVVWIERGTECSLMLSTLVNPGGQQ